MASIHQMLRYLENWRLYLLASIAIGTGTCCLGLAIAAPSFSQTPKKPASPNAPPANSSSTLPKAPTRSLLKTGSQGTEVVELQGVLKLLGYYTGSMTGEFDQATAIAVNKFQKAAGLTTDGIVGMDTWNRLLPPSPIVSTTAPPKSTGSQPNSTTPTKPPTSATNPSKNTATKPLASNSSTPTKQESATLPILRIGMQGSAVTGLQERLKALGFLKGASDGVFGSETQAAVKAAQKKFSLEPDGVVGTGTWLALLR